MPRYEPRAVHLPYCIKKLPHGGHVILNRDYKPLGFATRDFVDYEAYPIAVKFKGLTSVVASKLSWKGDPSTDTIYLYNDGTVPTASAANWNTYSERLSRLAGLKLDDRWTPPVPQGKRPEQCDDLP